MPNEARMEIGRQLMALVAELEKDDGLVERFNAGECSVVIHRTGASVIEYAPFTPGDLVEVPDPASFKTAYWKGFAGELLRFLELLSESKHAETWLAGKHWIKLEHDKFTIHASIEISGAES